MAGPDTDETPSHTAPIAKGVAPNPMGIQMPGVYTGPPADTFHRGYPPQPDRFFLPLTDPKQQLQLAYQAALQAQENYRQLAQALNESAFEKQAIQSLLESRQQQEAAALAAAPPAPMPMEPPPPYSQNPPNGMPLVENPAIQAARQQALLAQQQYMQDLGQMRQQQLMAQRMPFPQPPPPYPGWPASGQTTPPFPASQANGLVQTISIPPTPTTAQSPGGPIQPPLQPQPLPPTAESPPPPYMPQIPQTQAVTPPPTPLKPAAGFPFEQVNQVLSQADPASRWAALEQLGKQKSAPPFIYNTLRLLAMINSPLLPASFTADEKRGIQEASFWTLALLNNSQNANVPVSTPLKSADGKPLKNPKTNAPLYQFLPGLEEASAILSTKKADPQVQRAAIQMLLELLGTHPNDPTLRSILSSTVSSDPNVKALAKQALSVKKAPSLKPPPASGAPPANNPQPVPLSA